MILFTSSKGQDYSPLTVVCPRSEPIFQEKAFQLNKLLASLPPGQLKKLMGISDALCQETVQKIAAFATASRKPALFTYSGEAFKRLAPTTLDQTARDFGQRYFCILSGMYGLLRPYDLMAPYRLEMGYKLANKAGASLYPFWKGTVTQYLNTMLTNNASEALINLASVEYSKVIDKKALVCPFIDIQFKEEAGDSLKSVAIYAKRARGMMARYLLSNKTTSPAAIVDFQEEGYRHRPELSHTNLLVFTRPKP
nr:YaaA family protein [uncultured Desulfobulbus sp.]